MRALRTIFGVLLALFGVFAIALAVAGWTVQSHAVSGGSFTAQLRPVSTDGYAVIVPDLATVLDRHLAAGVLNPDRVRVTIERTSAPLRLWLVPRTALASYLDNVAWTELSGVGFSRGDQPVDLSDHPGTNVPAPLAEQSFWANAPTGPSLEWDRSTDKQVSLLLARSDEQPGFTASVTVAIYPSWLDEVTWLAVFVGVSALTVAATLLFWRRGRDASTVLSAAQAAELATLIAQRLAADHLGSGHLAPGHLGPAHLEPGRLAIDRPWPDRLAGPEFAIGRDTAPFGEVSGNATASRHTMAGRASGDAKPPYPARDLTGELITVPEPRDATVESPYVHTAT